MVSASCTGQYSLVPRSLVSLETRGAPSWLHLSSISLLRIKQLIPALEINEVRNLKH